MKTNKQLRRECVRHWKRMKKLSVEDIRAGKEYPGPSECAFCIEYWSVWGCSNNCPVKKRTGLDGCAETPHGEAEYIYNSIENKRHRRLSEFRKAVQAEIDFLEGLSCE